MTRSVPLSPGAESDGRDTDGNRNAIQHDQCSNGGVSSNLSRKWHREQRDSQPSG